MTPIDNENNLFRNIEGERVELVRLKNAITYCN